MAGKNTVPSGAFSLACGSSRCSHPADTYPGTGILFRDMPVGSIPGHYILAGRKT